MQMQCRVVKQVTKCGGLVEFNSAVNIPAFPLNVVSNGISTKDTLTKQKIKNRLNQRTDVPLVSCTKSWYGF